MRRCCRTTRTRRRSGYLAKYRGQGPTPAAEKYYAMVEWFDETCGKLDDYLAKDQLTENTVIL